jgi:hypothetical protein
MGQFLELADDLATLNYDIEKEGAFDKMLQSRNAANIALQAAYRIATEDRAAYCLPTQVKTETSTICMDIWQVIRHQLWLDNDGPEKTPWSRDGAIPMLESDEPPVMVTKDGNEQTMVDVAVKNAKGAQ